MRRAISFLTQAALAAVTAAQYRHTAATRPQTEARGIQAPAHGSGKPWRAKKAKRRGGK